MKAILLKGFGNTEEMYLGETLTPIITEDEVLIKAHATALNRADLLQRRGLYPPPPNESDIMGLEVAGEIVAIGKNVNDWKSGDRVFALLAGGGYATYVKAHKDMLMPIPSKMNYVQAAAIAEAFLTAYQAIVWLVELKKGETILIHAGASGVGTAAIQLAKNIGAKVYVTASKGKHDLCYALGADLCIDYKSEAFEEAILLKNKTGVDTIIDFIGASYFNQNLKALAMDGRMAILGLMGGMKLENANISPLLFKRLNITGSTLRSRSLDYKVRLTSDFIKDCLPLFGNGTLKPIIDSIFDWENVQEAHAYMEANRNQGKVILRIT